MPTAPCEEIDMKWFYFLFLIVCEGKKPNIVFLLVDDLGFNDVSWHNREVIMPNLDRLASEATHLKITDFHNFNKIWDIWEKFYALTPLAVFFQLDRKT